MVLRPMLTPPSLVPALRFSQTQIGWRFVSSRCMLGESRNQVGRFGLVDSRVERQGGPSRLSMTVDYPA